MRWTERQRAMLEEMGVRLWLPTDAPAVESVAGPPLAGRAARVATTDAPAPGGDALAGTPSRRPQGLPASEVAAGHAPAPGDGLATLDLAEVAARAAVCTACALCAGRVHSVFGMGHPRADWMLVGDAPDADDNLTGQPFSGPAGQLLDNMLSALALTRSLGPPSRQVYVTTAVKCHPPRSRHPEPAEFAACAPYLRRQVESVRPRLIVALGRGAAQSLLRSAESTTQLRGRVHRFADVPVIVTHHPAYLLRHPQDKAQAWADLCLALQVAREPGAA